VFVADESIAYRGDAQVRRTDAVDNADLSSLRSAATAIGQDETPESDENQRDDRGP
jgi:hypothetical protein